MTTATKRPVRLRSKGAAAVPMDESRDLMVDAFGWTVAAYEEAKEHVRQAYARYKATPNHGRLPATEEDYAWERWINHCQALECDLMRQVIAAVLIANGRIEDSSEVATMSLGWKPCAFEHKGTLYVVAQDPGAARDAVLPVLTIVDHNDLNADWMTS